MPPLSKNKLIIAGGALLLIVVVLYFIFANAKPSKLNAPNLTVWGIDRAGTFDKFTVPYSQLHPGAQIKYLQVPEDSYEDTLIKALAAGQGPDVAFIPSYSLPKLKDVLAPLVGTVFTPQNFKDTFPTVAAQDFISAEKIYAAPLYIDSLVLVYNRDLFDKAAIAAPPATWDDFQKIIPKLRVLNSQGQIARAAAALGGTEKSVAHATDILNLLMLQNGAPMPSEAQPDARFATAEGAAALNFYLQFSNPASPVYTWNEAQKNSLDSFAAGETAMIFAYQGDLGKIKEKNPFVVFDVAPIPQTAPSSPVTYASYGGLAVSKQSAQFDAAWDYAGVVSVGNPKLYSDATGRPPATRALIAEKANDPALGVFAKQALSARSWRIPDYGRVVDIFNNEISKVISGRVDAMGALREAQDSISLIQ